MILSAVLDCDIRDVYGFDAKYCSGYLNKPRRFEGTQRFHLQRPDSKKRDMVNYALHGVISQKTRIFGSVFVICVQTDGQNDFNRLSAGMPTRIDTSVVKLVLYALICIANTIGVLCTKGATSIRRVLAFFAMK